MPDPSTQIDLSLEYLGGFTAPNIEQDRFALRARFTNSEGDIEYVAPQQTLTGAGAWDGASESIAVFGSGARAITLVNPSILGWELLVIDAAGSAGAGSITIDPAGATTINGAATLVLATNFASARLRYVATGAWVRV